MKIAFLSYAFPPDTAVGGIATYVNQAAGALAHRGHHVEVFCGSPTRQSHDERRADGVVVHCIRCADRASFGPAVVPHFVARHEHVAFDLMESPEYGADGLLVKKRLPELATVVRCHTPSYFVKRLNRTFRAGQWRQRVKQALGLARYHRQRDPEYQLALLADGLASPSNSLRDHLVVDWQLDPQAVRVVPYIFAPSPEMLSIAPETDTRTVTFVGRLEVRKGLVALGDAIPQILARHPEARFRFVGKSGPAPLGRGSMADYLRARLASHAAQLEFVDHVAPSEIPEWLARTDICVFPSLWENFPNVCLEAMSAARGIVASRAGGMRDMLIDIEGGELIEPTKSDELAAAVCRLLDDPQRRQARGRRCRDKVLRYYADQVIEMTEGYYAEIFARSTSRLRAAA